MHTSSLQQERTPAEELLQAMQLMDLKLIRRLLKNRFSLCPEKRKGLMFGMREVFYELWAAGDTRLLYHPGYCNSATCYNNFMCKGYRFTGNNSRFYFNLIIKDEDGLVTDIHECVELLCLENELLVVKPVYLSSFHEDPNEDDQGDLPE